MKRTILFLGVALFTSSFAMAQAPSILTGQGFLNGFGIGVPVGSNFSDAALHIKANPNPLYFSSNGQQIFFCETSNAPGDNFRIMNGKGGVGNTFIPSLIGTNTTDIAAPALAITANTSLSNDVANGSPLMIFNTSKGFTPNTSLETPGAAVNIANRPLFQWRNNSALLMTMTPTTAALGDARLSLGTTAAPTYKFELSSPFANDGIRVTNTSQASASLRLKANTGREWSINSTGIGNSVGANHLFIQDQLTSTYRFFINGLNGNIGMGNTNTLTTLPQLKLDINTNSPNDGIRVTQNGTTAATLSLTGGSSGGKRWALHSTGTGNVQGAGHLLFWDWTTNVEKMRINQNGFVGINTAVASISAQPTHLFHVKSNTTVAGINVDPVRIETLNAANDNSLVTVDANGVLHTRSIASLPGAGITSSCTNANYIPVVNSAAGDLRCGNIYDNGNVGIGTTSPLHKVHINNGALMLSGAVPGFGGPQLLFTDNLTTNPNGRWAIEYTSAPPVGGLNFWTPFPGGAAGNYSLFLRNDGKVGMGVTDDPGNSPFSSTAFAGNYRLYVKDGILTDKVKVAVYNTTNWADYVFAPGYKLKSLDEVEAFTKANKHLPGLQSAEEMVKDGGIDVGRMFAKQMEKIEELTLYMIEMKKEIKALKNENAELKSSIFSPSKN